jgi:threonine/homoserine/homoserine lactone efflux protein
MFGLRMDPSHYAAFVAVSLVVICTPGQDTALTIRNTLSGQRPAGVATAFGVATGQATWTLATALGLAALLTASEPVFATIRLLGAAYLVYLGLRSLPAAIKGGDGAAKISGSGPALSARSAFRQGLISNLSNVKMVAFFTSLLPQFAVPRPTLLLLLTLGANFCLLTLAWLIGYALAVERMNRLLRRSLVRRWLEAFFGVALVGLGLRLGAESQRVQ